tara:strand:- start:221 stop:442 length:222 start_codon:yes stop_codon:yes gene_type:complete
MGFVSGSKVDKGLSQKPGLSNDRLSIARHATSRGIRPPCEGRLDFFGGSDFGFGRGRKGPVWFLPDLVCRIPQ